MKKNMRGLSGLLSLAMVASLGLSGCTGSGTNETTANQTTAAPTSAQETTAVEPTSEQETSQQETEPANPDNYIDLALNVYFNDADHEYYSNEAGDIVTIYGDGQYTVEFDCTTDLSSDAVNAGVNSLTNLTAIYIYDMGMKDGKQSPLKSADIMYDKVVVDGQELTVTLEAPKSAFKSNGVFDTNDPVNAWEGSYIAEVEDDTSKHVSNFKTIENPKKIEVTFTLSNMSFAEKVPETDPTPSGENTNVNTAVFSDIDFTGMNALEFTKYMGNGINLGNTMEAVSAGLGKNAKVSSYETAWGQPVTTEAMIKGMKNCGFDTIRIPVAWTNMMDYENDDYTINTALLDRVEEIVKWALDAEMFVIVNDHWDSGWWDLFSGDEAEVEKAWKIYESIWTQVSERFADYSDMLILESANEELGRGWTSKGMSSSDAYKLTTQVNQKFVDIVRKSGGNNDDRFLLIAGNATDINLTVSNEYVMPEDTVSGKLLISVHYYDPWNYCGDKSNVTEEKIAGYKWGLKEEYEYMAKQLAKMDKFTEAGYGVIIGEWGALPAYISSKVVELPCTSEYSDFLLDVCDMHNFCPVLWSTGTFDKTKLTLTSQSLVDVFVSHSYAQESKAGDAYLTNVKAEMDDLVANAPEQWEGQETYEPGTPVAWIMWNGGAGTYSVGDTFNAADCTAGITAHNVVVDGAGEYTVSLEFAGGNDGLTFGAIGMMSGEDLYPGCIIDIKSITANGEALDIIATPYTSADDKHCTRVNLVNEWVGKIPKDARNASGDLTNASAVILDKSQLVGINDITITFELIIPE